MNELVIKNLHVSVDDVEILKGVNLTIKKGEIVALLGPNGHGKSTLLAAIMGNPRYKVTEGSITLDGEDVLSMEVDERSRKGLFLAFQNPSEIQGVVTADFYKSAINVRREKKVNLYEFYKMIQKASDEVKLPFDMVNRHLNDGFSGGEKKRNEILQMLLLKPDFAMLDEIDSGLDVDAINTVIVFDSFFFILLNSSILPCKSSFSFNNKSYLFFNSLYFASKSVNCCIKSALLLLLFFKSLSSFFTASNFSNNSLYSFSNASYCFLSLFLSFIAVL